MAARKKAARKKTAKRNVTSKRELIATGPTNFYARHDVLGEFEKMVDVSRSVAADRRSKSKTVVKKGQGNRGDQKRTDVHEATVPQGSQQSIVGRRPSPGSSRLATRRRSISRRRAYAGRTR